MTRVATYVFLDLETTSLPQIELNKTKITELSMVVVKRRHVLDTRPGAAPRVQEKLTLCFNPRRMIDPGSTEVSGLDNDLLEHQTPFNMNVFTTINSFLHLFEKPVCLIAQKGHTFDFPILKNHFEKLGVSLPDDILCADSLNAFYDIDLKRDQANVSEPGVSVVDHAINGVNGNESSSDLKQNNAKIEEAETRSDKVIQNDSITHSEEHITEDVLKDFEENDDLNSQQKIQQQNERTPTQKKHIPDQTKARNKVKRKIFFETGTEPCKAPKKSYKLLKVYERILGRPGIVAHRAENDCIMAMEASVALAKDFVEWVDNNHCKFSEVSAMKLGVPLGD